MDSGSEPIRSVVRDGDGLSFGRELEYASDGAKDFLSTDDHLVGDSREHRRLNEVSLVSNSSTWGKKEKDEDSSVAVRFALLRVQEETKELTSSLQLGLLLSGLDVLQDLVELRSRKKMRVNQYGIRRLKRRIEQAHLDLRDQRPVKRVVLLSDLDLLHSGNKELEELVVDLRSREVEGEPSAGS